MSSSSPDAIEAGRDLVFEALVVTSRQIVFAKPRAG